MTESKWNAKIKEKIGTQKSFFVWQSQKEYCSAFIAGFKYHVNIEKSAKFISSTISKV